MAPSGSRRPPRQGSAASAGPTTSERRRCRRREDPRRPARALDHRERHRAEFVVPRHRGDPTDLALAEQHRRPGAGSLCPEPSRCRNTSRRGGRPRLCTRATVSCRGSSPSAGGRPCAASRPRAGWCGGRSRSRAGAARRRPAGPPPPRCRPAAGRRPRLQLAPRGTTARASRGPAPGGPRAGRTGVSPGSPGHGSTQASGSPGDASGAERLAEHRPVLGHVGDLDPQHERIRSSQASSAGTVPGSTVIQLVSPSSTRCRACSTCPGATHERLSRGARASPSRCWVVIECSQDSRSGPLTVRRRGAKVTAACPRSCRCSRTGSP